MNTNTTRTLIGRQFDTNDAALLRAAGWDFEHVDAYWEDTGDAENGPHLTGHVAYDVWSANERPGVLRVLVVLDGVVVDDDLEPDLPPDWFEPHGDDTINTTTKHD